MNKQEIILDVSVLREDQRTSGLIRTILTVLVTFSSIMAFTDGFLIETDWKLLLAAVVFAAALIQALSLRQKLLYIASAAGTAALAVGTALAFDVVTNGFTGILNQILTTVNKNMAMANLLFVVNQKNLKRDSMVSLILLALVLTVMIRLLIQFKKNYLVSALLTGALTVGMIYGSPGNPIWVGLGLLGLLGVLYFGNISGKITRDMYLLAGSVAAVIGTVTLAVFFTVYYEPLQVIDDAKEAIVYHGGNLLYGKSDYPQGRFSRFETLELTGASRLRVQMSRPQTMYLRGFVGCKYTPEGWEQNDQNIYAGEYEGVFEWFVQQQYYPLTTAADFIAISAGESKTAGTDRVGVTVENTGASRKYQYLPENITFDSLGGLYSAKKDVNFVAQGYGSTKPYDFSVQTVPGGSYKTIYTLDWYQNAKEPYQTFLDCEGVYNYFVRQNYLEVSPKLKSYFGETLPDCGKNPFDAVNTVRDYLEQKVAYSEEVEEYQRGEDFIIELLESRKSGYSAHYATAACMMLRYYGVPARYVEGYLVTQEQDKKEVEVTDRDAHAWIEAYVNGIGFIPFDVTPGFYTKEDAAGGGAGGGSAAGSQSAGQEEEIREEKEDQPSVFRETYVIELLAALFVSLILFLVIRRSVIGKRRYRRMYGADLAAAVGEAGEYMQKLLAVQNKKLEEEISGDMLELLQRLKFGRSLPDAAETKLVCEYAVRIRNQVYTKEKKWGRFKLAYIYCLV